MHVTDGNTSVILSQGSIKLKQIRVTGDGNTSVILPQGSIKLKQISCVVRMGTLLSFYREVVLS